MSSGEKPEVPKRRNQNLSQDGGLPATVNGVDNEKTNETPKPKLIPEAELDKMVSESMRDIDNDEELPDDDDDPELLRELEDIASGEHAEVLAEKQEVTGEQVILSTRNIETISIIKSRIEMYKLAENAAKEAGESAKDRRFTRGLKALNDLLKQIVAGENINVDDIPPEVSVRAAKSPVEPDAEPLRVPSRTAPAVPSRPE